MVYDLFICHASEDKEEVARPLSEALRQRGRTVWLDELEVKLGDSLRQKIDEGLRNSRFGVVILSPSFFAKRWTQWELDGLAQREMLSGEKVVLPIWHRVTVEDVAARSPSLADRRAALTADGIDAVVEQIEAVFASSAAALPPVAAQAGHATPVAHEPVLVLAPPSQHRLDDPHQVTPDPQPMWAQTAFVQVENVGAAIAFIRGFGADPSSVGTVTVRPPAAIGPATARPVQLIVSTMTPDVRVSAGEPFRFWLDYGRGEQPDRRLWAVARYNAGGGWDNIGSDNRLLADQSQRLSQAAQPPSGDEAARLLARMAFASSELAGVARSLVVILVSKITY